MDIVLWGILVVGAVAGIFVFLVPNEVRYEETILIEAPLNRVYDNVRCQEDLMRWSAWPSVTNSTCEVVGNDGTIGVKIVFFKKGKRFGHQELTALQTNSLVAFKLVGAGPPQDPRLTFRFESIAPTTTKVVLEFRNELPRPFNVLLRAFGIVAWTRRMHLKDLDGLKRYSEPPFETYVGDPIPPRSRPIAS